MSYCIVYQILYIQTIENLKCDAIIHHFVMNPTLYVLIHCFMPHFAILWCHHTPFYSTIHNVMPTSSIFLDGIIHLPFYDDMSPSIIIHYFMMTSSSISWHHLWFMYSHPYKFSWSVIIIRVLAGKSKDTYPFKIAYQVIPGYLLTDKNTKELLSYQRVDTLL